MKSIWFGAAALALLFSPSAHAAPEPMMKLAGMLRCAAVYQVTAERAAEGSEAQHTASRQMLQYYMIMLARAESRTDDNLTADTLKTLFNAEHMLAKSDVTLARIDGKLDGLFDADFATCAAFRNSQPSLFATADQTIDVLAKAEAEQK